MDDYEVAYPPHTILTREEQWAAKAARSMPPGWYPVFDDMGNETGHEHYFDGTRWTEQCRTRQLPEG